MENPFVPNGSVKFQGEYADLLHAISVINGDLKNAEQFRCHFYFPSREFQQKYNRLRIHLLRIRGRFSYVFHCSFTRRPDGYEITYKVYPGPVSVLVLSTAIMSLYYSLVAQDHQQILLGTIMSIIILLIFIFTRHMCVKQFKEFFMRKS